MFRLIFVFLLLNSSYRSLGGPVPSNAPVIANLLTVLANSCENKFLSDEIKNRLEYCSEITSPHQGKQLECLLFYDINSQLCNAIGTSKLALSTDDYSTKIKEEQDVTELCEATNDWVFSNLTEFPHYKVSVEKVFKHPAMCGKVCGVSDLMSDDANFFCKYFKWGSDMLKSLSTLPPEDNAGPSPPEIGEIVNKPVISASNDIDVQIKNSTTSITASSHSEAVPAKVDESFQYEATKPKESDIKQSLELPSANSVPSEKSETKTDKTEEPVSVTKNQLLPNDPNDAASQPVEVKPELKSEDPKPESPDTTLTKPDSEDLQKTAVDNEIQQLNNELEHKEPVIETPGQSKGKQPVDTEDYQDSDEGKDGLGDIQGDDDSDDAMIGDTPIKINKLEDVKEEPEESHKQAIMPDITSESRLFPGFGQDDDDDDHFFSFFLTAVIMVVLIYVLYHNKNKVGKVFFGLILEGRQSGRRRNSRGHSYRRLDTLEQAMSTNTAAPPSKIIY